MAHVQGTGCKIYYDTDGGATPVFTSIEGLITDSLNVTQAIIDTTDKDSGNWGDHITGIRGWTTDFEAHIDTGSTAQEKVIDDLLIATQVIAKIEYKTSNSSKYSGSCSCTDYSLSNAFNDSQKVSGTLTGTGALTQAAV
jgi:predicted secreted protein